MSVYRTGQLDGVRKYVSASDGMILCEARGPIAEIRLNRPRFHNAIDRAAAYALDTALTAAEADPAIRVVILAAAGPTFCAGQDLRALQAGEPEAFIEGRGWAGLTHRDRTKPLIAVIQGPALGGGFEIALAADLVVASTAARFGLPEVHHGLVAGAGGASRLPNRIPRIVAKEMLLTGEPIDATRAAALGLVNLVVEPNQLQASAEELALRITSNPTGAVTAALAVANQASENGNHAADELAGRLLAELLETDDARAALDRWVTRSESRAH